MLNQFISNQGGGLKSQKYGTSVCTIILTNSVRNCFVTPKPFMGKWGRACRFPASGNMNVHRRREESMGYFFLSDTVELAMRDMRSSAFAEARFIAGGRANSGGVTSLGSVSWCTGSRSDPCVCEWYCEITPRYPFKTKQNVFAPSFPKYP